jgi:phasin family protein
MRDSMKEVGDAVSAITAAKTVEEKFAKQAEMTKAAYVKSVSDMRELSELQAKSSQEAFEVLNARVAEGLDEFGKQVKKVA